MVKTVLGMTIAICIVKVREFLHTKQEGFMSHNAVWHSGKITTTIIKKYRPGKDYIGRVPYWQVCQLIAEKNRLLTDCQAFESRAAAVAAVPELNRELSEYLNKHAKNVCDNCPCITGKIGKAKCKTCPYVDLEV
jgi:hypothetical protein